MLTITIKLSLWLSVILGGTSYCKKRITLWDIDNHKDTQRTLKYYTERILLFNVQVFNAISILFIFLLLLSSSTFAQQEYITVTGKRGIGKTINGEMVREFVGDVVLTQGNIRVTCDTAIEYISRNDAELIGNVIATQDTLTITTPHAFYYGNEKKALSNSGVKLDDKKVILTADSGVYSFDQKKAIFNSKVKLFDTASTLTSNKLTYFKNEGKAIAVGNVKIVESQDIIRADSLIHFRESRITYAFKNVIISDTSKSSFIYGDHLEDFPGKYYSYIDENPLYIQIDTSYTNKIDTLAGGKIDTLTIAKLDTLFIRSKKMEAYRDTINIFKAEDSVEIVRGEFASRNDFTVFYRSSGKIVTNQLNKESAQPIIWYENSQLTGDSVVITLKKNKIKELEVDNNAFLLSQNEMYKKRFDQLSGSKIKIFFNDNGIYVTEGYGGVHSIYYLYEENSPNGLTKSSSESAKILFKNKKVSTVKLYGTPVSEYYPERKVKGDELAFTLPGYILYKNRPDKEKIISNYPDRKNIFKFSKFSSNNLKLIGNK